MKTLTRIVSSIVALATLTAQLPAHAQDPGAAGSTARLAYCSVQLQQCMATVQSSCAMSGSDKTTARLCASTGIMSCMQSFAGKACTQDAAQASVDPNAVQPTDIIAPIATAVALYDMFKKKPKSHPAPAEPAAPVIPVAQPEMPAPVDGGQMPAGPNMPNGPVMPNGPDMPNAPVMPNGPDMQNGMPNGPVMPAPADANAEVIQNNGQ